MCTLRKISIDKNIQQKVKVSQDYVFPDNDNPPKGQLSESFTLKS